MSNTNTEQRPLIILLHIPKTGGSSLNTAFRNVYGKRFIRINEGVNVDNAQAVRDILKEDPYQYDAIAAHFAGFGIHEYSPRPIRYVTLLRNPTNRAISQYYHILRKPGHKRHKQFTPLEGLEAALPLVGQNLQTRVLSGVAPKQPLTEADLETAKRNVEAHFLAVGTLERLDELLLVLKHLLDWPKTVATPHRNVGTNRPRTLPPEVIEKANQFNALDFQLYDYVDHKLSEQIKALGVTYTLDTFRSRTRRTLSSFRRRLSGKN